jgi:hypothetical protein
MRLKSFIVALIVGIVLFSPLRVEADGDIKIGVSVGLTGKYAEMADMQKKAYLLW